MEIKVGEYSYPSIMGSFARPPPIEAGILLNETPTDFKSYFFCVCGRELYDGGMCLAVYCSCGSWVKRTEDDQISILQGEPQENKCNSKGFAEPANLLSISFGIFADNILKKYIKSRDVDYEKISKILREFFVRRLRCMEENAVFSYNNLKFKVLACQPSQGFVVKNTRIILTQKLCSQPVKELEIMPVAPHLITDEIFDSVFLPYFTQREIHIHPGQHISIYGLECIITKTKPKDGFVVPEVTEFTYSESSLAPIHKLELFPYIEDLPPYFSQLEMGQFIQNMLSFYIMPYFIGWKRPAKQGQIIEICGIDFKIMDCLPDEGLVDMNSTIAYDGSTISRRRNPQISQEIRELRELVIGLEQELKIKNEKLSQMPEFLMKNLPKDNEQKNCVICLCEFEVGSKCRVFPCCMVYLGHIFHKHCCDKWLRRNLSCPICKTIINL